MCRYDNQLTTLVLTAIRVNRRCIISGTWHPPLPSFLSQLLLKAPGVAPCGLCESRCKIQSKYLDQIADLYEDFHIVKLPLLEREVRGTESVRAFSEHLVTPYVPK